MKIAIHHRKGSFSDRWIEYCKENSIDYKIVNAYSSDIIEEVRDCDIFMWHHDHNNIKDETTAKRILFALEHSGKIVFPDFKTGWHFDDKVAQKYLLEAIGAPLVPSYVFYDERDAKTWLEKISVPKVFKLKGGSGSSNVRIIKSRKDALKLIEKAFGKGISRYSFSNYAKEKWRHYKENGNKPCDLLKIIYRFLISPHKQKNIGKERNYLYFQDFMPENNFDIRIIVIDNKAFGIRRRVRKNDFRASGSGHIEYDKSLIDLRCVEHAFKVNKKLGSICTSFDFIFNENKTPYIVEISYGYASNAYYDCSGYWDDDLKWNPSSFKSEEWIIETVIKKFKC